MIWFVQGKALFLSHRTVTLLMMGFLVTAQLHALPHKRWLCIGTVLVVAFSFNCPWITGDPWLWILEEPTMFVWHHWLFSQIAASMRTLSPKIRGHGIQDLRLVWVAPATKQIIRLLYDLIKPHLQCYVNFFFDWATQFGHFEKCEHVFFVFGFPLEDIKRAMLQPAHVWDLRRPSWSNKLSAILDLRKIRQFLVVTFAPLEVAFRQFTIHVIHLDHQESELWPRSVASHFYGLIQIIIFAFLSFRKIGSLVLVEALA